MELNAVRRDSGSAAGRDVLRERGLNPGLGLGELLNDLRSGEGFAWLLKGLLRSLGQESTRYLLKRHGYRLGGREAEVAPLRQTEMPAHRPMHAFIDALRVHLQVREVSSGLAPGEGGDATLAWHCALDASQGQNFENRINHENAFVWLLMGYAAGYLNQFCDKSFHITYARQVLQGEVTFRFFARASRDAKDFDQDLLLPNFRHGTDPQAQEAPAPALAQPRREPRRILREESELTSVLKQVASTDATVLLLGESGVGKSLVAGELHAMSLRARQPWVEINCAAIPEQLIESELFGVERGAFSGATLSRKGKFEQAHGGTIFLDEVALLSPGAQSKLLRVLQSGEFERLGSNTTVRCDLRVIAATNEPLERLVQEGKFREDLYFRLNVFPVHIPPLRDRRNEIPGLASAIIQKLSEKYRKKIPRCSAQAREVLLTYDWPGNIRELENVLERAVILCPPAAEIQPMHLGGIVNKCRTAQGTQTRPQIMAPERPREPSPQGPAAPAKACLSVDDWADQVIENRLGGLTAVKGAMLRAALRRSNGNVPLAAASLGLTRSQLTYQLKKMSGVGVDSAGIESP